jgi:hypothetical protein
VSQARTRGAVEVGPVGRAEILHLLALLKKV